MTLWLIGFDDEKKKIEKNLFSVNKTSKLYNLCYNYRHVEIEYK